LRHIQGGIDHTAQQVRPKGTIFIEAANVFEDAKKCFLNNFFSDLLVVYNQKRRAKCLDLVASDQHLQSADIPIFQATNGLAIIIHALLH
jgi:hypothetical protein